MELEVFGGRTLFFCHLIFFLLQQFQDPVSILAFPMKMDFRWRRELGHGHLLLFALAACHWVLVMQNTSNK